VTDTAPADIGDVEQTIHTAEVEERTEVGDVLDDTLEYLTFFEASEDLLALFGQIAFDECLVADNSVFDLLVDLHHFEFHDFAYVLIVVNHRFDVNL
jgi:hypothetical protein